MVNIKINFLIITPPLIYLIAFLGLIFNKRNILISILCIELLLLSINLNFLIFSLYLDDCVGQTFVIFILTIAATESVIGLAILFSYYKLTQSILIKEIV